METWYTYCNTDIHVWCVTQWNSYMTWLTWVLETIFSAHLLGYKIVKIEHCMRPSSFVVLFKKQVRMLLCYLTAKWLWPHECFNSCTVDNCWSVLFICQSHHDWFYMQFTGSLIIWFVLFICACNWVQWGFSSHFEFL